MKKNAVLGSLLELVFVIIFSIVFFINDGGRSDAGGWTAFGFIMLAYLMLLLTRYMARSDQNAVLGLSIYLVSTLYFFLQFAVGLFFLFTETDSYKLELTLQIVLFGIYLLLLIPALMANNETRDALEKQKNDSSFIKENTSRVKLLLDKMDDRKADRTVQHVYDILHASPVMSDPSVESAEKQITEQVEVLEKAVIQNDVERVGIVADRIEKLVERRNTLLKNK